MLSVINKMEHEEGHVVDSSTAIVPWAPPEEPVTPDVLRRSNSLSAASSPEIAANSSSWMAIPDFGDLFAGSPCGSPSSPVRKCNPVVSFWSFMDKHEPENMFQNAFIEPGAVPLPAGKSAITRNARKAKVSVTPEKKAEPEQQQKKKVRLRMQFY